jgi:hypothetical protein
MLPAHPPVASSSRIVDKQVICVSVPSAPEVLAHPTSSPVLDLNVLIIEDNDDDETPRKRSKPSTLAGPSPEQVSLAKYTIVSLEENILNMRVFLKGMEKHMSEAE